MATRSGEDVLLVDVNLHGDGGPAVKRRGRRRGGARRRVARRKTEREDNGVRCSFAGGGKLYIPTDHT